MRITWFRHSHENRNDLLRFGLMRKHYAGEVYYTERPFTDLTRFGFGASILNHPDPRHLSFLLLEDGKTKTQCLVDSEDSFALITELVKEVDVCFCAGYNSDFFERQQFVKTYHWQTETDIAWYRQTLEQKIEKLGEHFYKIKRFVPIGPNQGGIVKNSVWKQRYKNLLSKLDRLTGQGDNFFDVYKSFEIREAELLSLRNHTLEYDVVLNDSLWGWPQHRLNLHRELQRLSEKGRKIHSILNWTEPGIYDGSLHRPLDKTIFPMKTASIDKGYETMLAQSRLAVFACGFHWGWRNVMMLALKTGIPVLTDRLLTEAHFSMNEFVLFLQEDSNWICIDEYLQNISFERWQEIKINNSSVYDRYMCPEAVAEYFLSQAQAA